MRTTVSLDDDVAVRLEQRRAAAGTTFKQALNALLRQGLEAAEHPSERTPVTIAALPVGRRLLDVDNIAETLALAEKDDFR